MTAAHQAASPDDSAHRPGQRPDRAATRTEHLSTRNAALASQQYGADGVLVLELESFSYEYTRTGVRYGAPEGMTDDCVCALALAREHYVARQRSCLPPPMAGY